MWRFFDVAPGQRASVSIDVTDEYVPPELNAVQYAALYCVLPDAAEVIRLPQEMGGALERVAAVATGVCACGEEHMVKIYTLETCRVYGCTVRNVWLWAPVSV